MKSFGLIGYKLGHSFSKKFFTEKFQNEELIDCEYVNFELDSINEFPELFKRNDHIFGLNCTIPYKQQLIPFLDEICEEAAGIGAVNTVKVVRQDNKLKLEGYNTDAYGFEHSFRPFLKEHHKKALILGTGGASKAVKYVLNKLNITYLSATTKEILSDGEISYNKITPELLSEYLIIIQTTPLGMYPKTDTFPDLPYHSLTPNHLLYDLVYNPEETQFMIKGIERGATVSNGLQMLHLQALKAWEIWNK